MRLRLVAALYAVVFAVSALMVFQRYLLYVRNPQDVAAAGGMYAGGDLALEIIIFFLFLVPTIALVFVIRNSESACMTYAKALLGFSLTAPMSVVLMVIPVLNQWYWGDFSIFRLFAIPIVLAVLMFSRWMIRFARPRRIVSYALMVEGLTLVATVAALFFFFSKGSHG
jgi:hypothetical protein